MRTWPQYELGLQSSRIYDKIGKQNKDICHQGDTSRIFPGLGMLQVPSLDREERKDVKHFNIRPFFNNAFRPLFKTQ